MSEIMKIDTVRQYNDYFGVETLHLSVSVIEGCKAKPLRYCRKLYNLYAILLKDTDCGQLKLRAKLALRLPARHNAFLAPGQIMGLKTTEGYINQKASFPSWILQKTPLARLIKEYSIFPIMQTKHCIFRNKNAKSSSNVWKRYGQNYNIPSTNTANHW